MLRGWSARLDRRIAATVIGITAGTVLVAAVGLWLSARSLLLRELDRELLQRAERLQFAATHPPPNEPRSRPWWLRPPPEPQQRPQRGDRRLMQFRDAESGRELTRSPNLPEGADLMPGGHPEDEGPHDLHLPQLGPVRVLVVILHPLPAPETPRTVVAGLGSELQPLYDELAHLAWALAALWGASVLLAFGAVVVAVPATLRPLRTLTAAIDHLGPDDLSARIGEGTGPAEARALVRRLNQLLDRLEAAFRREQATIASIAHELRTPVATLRATIEFRLLAAPGAEERGILDRCLGTVLHMQEQVSALLLLARLEAGKEAPALRLCVLADLVAEAVERWEERAHARGQRIEAAIDDGIEADTSPAHLALVLDNLLGNAVAHGAEGGAIAVALTRAGGGALLAVGNPLAGAAPDAGRLGEAYYRADDARRDSGHSGLGLALCRRLARLLGAELELGSADGRFRAALRLPLGA